MQLTSQQRFHLQRALREGKLDALDPRNRLTTIKGLFKKGLLNSEDGMMTRYYSITPKGERTLPKADRVEAKQKREAA